MRLAYVHSRQRSTVSTPGRRLPVWSAHRHDRTPSLLASTLFPFPRRPPDRDRQRRIEAAGWGCWKKDDRTPRSAISPVQVKFGGN